MRVEQMRIYNICFGNIKHIDVKCEIYTSGNLPCDIPLHSRIGVARLRVKISYARLACWRRTTNALPSWYLHAPAIPHPGMEASYILPTAAYYCLKYL